MVATRTMTWLIKYAERIKGQNQVTASWTVTVSCCQPLSPFWLLLLLASFQIHTSHPGTAPPFLLQALAEGSWRVNSKLKRFVPALHK